MSDLAAVEGDDACTSSRTLRVYFHGSQFASAENATVALSARGPKALETLARELLMTGVDPDTEIELHRGGVVIGRTSVGEAAHQSF